MELSDDPDIGPLFPLPNKYSIAQLQSFSDKLTQLRFWFNEKAGNGGMFDNSLFDNSNGFSSMLSWTTFY